MAFFDNRLLLNFWDMVSSRWQMTALELYDHSQAEPSIWRMIFGAITSMISNFA